jgi:(3,5-dihydroxyphenyl)acetyl-CoA 1,2-dioxygenase
LITDGTSVGAGASAREQAYCHFSPALIANLERNWNAKERALET